MNGLYKLYMRDAETRFFARFRSEYKNEIERIYLLGYKQGGYDAIHYNPNGNLCRDCEFYYISKQKRSMCSLWNYYIEDHSNKSCKAFETKRERRIE